MLGSAASGARKRIGINGSGGTTRREAAERYAYPADASSIRKEDATGNVDEMETRIKRNHVRGWIASGGEGLLGWPDCGKWWKCAGRAVDLTWGSI